MVSLNMYIQVVNVEVEYTRSCVSKDPLWPCGLSAISQVYVTKASMGMGLDLVHFLWYMLLGIDIPFFACKDFYSAVLKFLYSSSYLLQSLQLLAAVT